jgi:putative membrane protein
MPITRRGWFRFAIPPGEREPARLLHDATITRWGRGTVTRNSTILPGVDGVSDDRPRDTAGDATRRTHLANERTYLAWWRTGVTALAASVAVGRVVPSLTHNARWPYAVIGVGFALLGIVAIAYGFERQRDVREAVEKGEFAHPSDRVLLILTVAGVVLACGLLVIVAGNF